VVRPFILHCSSHLQPTPPLVLLWGNDEVRENLLRVDIIVIDEISMVSGDLLSYLSDIFSRLHNIHRPFGKVNVILVGDLFQLPPVSGSMVFDSPVWSLFYPLMLSTSHRQNEDTDFFNMLEELRMGTPTMRTIRELTKKRAEYEPEKTIMTTTHIVGYRQHADRLNNLITSSISDQVFESVATDYIDGHQQEPGEANRIFKGHTNLPDLLHIVVGARVMFLNNSL